MSHPLTPITHEELSANKLLSELPTEKQEVLRRYSLMKGQTMVATLKECLLKVADEINASRETAQA